MMGSRNHNGWTQNAENGFDLLQPHHEDGKEFLNHIVQDDET
jgi:hypothetical protein